MCVNKARQVQNKPVDWIHISFPSRANTKTKREKLNENLSTCSSPHTIRKLILRPQYFDRFPSIESILSLDIML